MRKTVARVQVTRIVVSNKATPDAMYVCICHGITDSEIDRSLAQGCRTVGDVFRQRGERPQCGKCIPDLCRRTSPARGGRPSAPIGAAAE